MTRQERIVKVANAVKSFEAAKKTFENLELKFEEAFDGYFICRNSRLLAPMGYGVHGTLAIGVYKDAVLLYYGDENNSSHVFETYEDAVESITDEVSNFYIDFMMPGLVEHRDVLKYHTKKLEEERASENGYDE